MTQTALSGNGEVAAADSKGKRRGSQLVLDELHTLGSLVLPIAASTFLQVLMGFVDSIIVGHLGSHELAASALGNMWFNCLWFFCFGALSAIDTLVAQAHGAKMHAEVKAVVV